MDTLRLWILLFGLLFIAAVYGWGRYQERRAARRDGFELVGGAPDDVPERELRSDDEAYDWLVMPLHARRDPDPDEFAIPVLEDVVAPPQPNPAIRWAPVAEPASPEPAPELIVVLGVAALPGRELAGADLEPAFVKAGLHYGEMNIFHAPVDLECPDGPALFSIANMVEPGTLEPEKLKLLATPGLFVFTRLPGPVNGAETFEHMQATSRFLANALGGQVCDERREPLTPEKAAEMRARIVSIIGDKIVVPED
ncbi:MAG: cell division protein ZipA C-terminal FtsZ-binding domain-containing protein [Gammaproteobacteria bacterium]|nr:cell division protein ZipA C-terminal FtsZ-binding domain-containing protein [Gammaproteobacteria bacterium]